MLELTAAQDGCAEAVVVEAHMEKGLGPVATVCFVYVGIITNTLLHRPLFWNSPGFVFWLLFLRKGTQILPSIGAWKLTDSCGR